MQSNYLVLKKQASPTRDVLTGAISMSVRSNTTNASSPTKLSVQSATRNTVRRAASESDTVAIAPIMPMRLIEPIPRVGAVDANETVWGLAATGADTSPFTGEGIVVAVVDTGIDASHPAFSGVEIIQKDFTNEGDGDRNGHGTHCAGTIFGRAVNGKAIGIAPGVKKAVIAKVLDQEGTGSSDAIVKGILWAVEQGAHIISISIGMDFPGYVKQLIEANMDASIATSRGLEAYRANIRLFESLASLVDNRGLGAQPTVIIAAAGNESARQMGPEFEVGVSPPAAAEGILSVGALGLNGDHHYVANFSNTGVNVSAPGVNIVSAAPGGGLKSLSGTSMATPHVAGVAALWAEKLNKIGALSSFQLVTKLAGTASNARMSAEADPLDYGAGMVQCPQS